MDLQAGCEHSCSAVDSDAELCTSNSAGVIYSQAEAILWNDTEVKCLANESRNLVATADPGERVLQNWPGSGYVGIRKR